MPQRLRRSRPPSNVELPPVPRRLRLAIVTAASGDLSPLAQQRRFLRDAAPGVEHVIVVDDRAAAQDVDGIASDPDVVLLELAAPLFTVGRARNLGARSAIGGGCDGLVNLCVDSVPLPGFLEAYLEAFAVCEPNRPWLFSGPITYLAPDDDLGTMRPARVADLVDPHPRRAFPPPGDIHVNHDHRLFLGDNFAVRVRDWRMLGGFCEDYAAASIGDLDVALRAEQARFAMAWVGGAHVLHAPPAAASWDVADRGIFERRWGFDAPVQELETRTSA